MEISLLLTAAILAYFCFKVFHEKKDWIDYIEWLPLAAFLGYARAYGMTNQAWIGAFELSGLLAVGVLAIIFHKKKNFRQVMLGGNCFLILGAIGFLFQNESIISWYASSFGGPFFACIFFVGLLKTFFSKEGFIGVKSAKKQTISYASILLLAATFCALIWSINTDNQGLLISVALPFLALRFVRHELKKHLF